MGRSGTTKLHNHFSKFLWNLKHEPFGRQDYAINITTPKKVQ